MLNNYTRTAWRSLLKNRSFTLINILGLSAGIAAFLFITTYIRYERSYESFNSNADNVWRVTYDIYNGPEYVITDCETHAPMAALIKSRFAEVEDDVRMYNCDGLNDVKVGDNKFLQTGLFFADASVFDILDVELIKGDAKTVLSEPNQVVLSESNAKRFYGNEDAIGKTMTLEGLLFHVTGIFKDRPLNTHLKFGMLMSHSTVKKTRDWYSDEGWDGNNEYLYLKMKPGTDINEFNRKLGEFSTELKDKLNNGKYVAQPIKDIHLYSNKSFEPEANGSAKTVSFLSIIAVAIIVIAWVNYMNLATARAVERAKEVGIRKVMGSVRRQLILQFLTESLFVNLVAAFVAIAFVQIGMPLFRVLTGMPETSTDILFWLLVIGLAVVGSMLSGIYPAFVLSSFSPVKVLKGKLQSSSHGQLLRKTLVVFQFAATIILIIGVSVVYLQVKHLRSVDLGTNLDQTIAVRLPAIPDSLFNSVYNNLKIEAMRDASIVSTTNSQAMPGTPIAELSTSRWVTLGKDENTGYEYYWYFVDQDFVKTMEMEIVAGRSFETSKEEGNILVNEEATKQLGFEKPEDAVGTQINWYDWRTKQPARIVGVVKNFHQRSPKEEFLPMVFPFNQQGGYFIARFNTDDAKTSVDKLRTAWDKVFPGDPFSYFFVDENFDEQYRADVQFGNVMGTFSVLAVMIACLGLFGLSSYTILQRRKEIGIRKVLGANISQVVGLLSGSYVKIILIASILALPIAWLAIDNWLSGYNTRITLSAWMFAIPVVSILMMALITVSFQTVKSALINPATSLKEE